MIYLKRSRLHSTTPSLTKNFYVLSKTLNLNIRMSKSEIPTNLEIDFLMHFIVLLRNPM